MRKLTLFFMSAVMTGCLLAGCGKSSKLELPVAETVSPSTEATETTTKEPETSATNSENDAKESGFSFADISDQQFSYSSGAGAWSTELTVHVDGSFEGQYHDSDMGDTGDGYPNGVCYISNFSGTFTQPEKVNDNTYSVTISNIELEKDPGTEEIEDGIKYIYSEPYGLDNAEEILIYLPGTVIEDLPEGYQSWMTSYGDLSDTKYIPFYGIYNVKAEEGFIGYDKDETEESEVTETSAIDEKLASIEKQAAILENKLQTEDMTQLEMTETSAELYQLWDDTLNTIWSQLKQKLDSATMDTLTKEERKWITYKEDEIEKAGADYEGGTMQPMVENEKGAELTKARVYELADYLR